MTDVVKQYSDIKESVEQTFRERADIMNRRGKVVVPRKYHMTEEQFIKTLEGWSERVVDVSPEIMGKAGTEFFNPYRANGAFYGGIQALFLLGANEWHQYGAVRGKMQEDMGTRKSPTNKKNSWEMFALRSAREGAVSTKDLMGRIVHNFRTLQRLGGLSPYGFKLRQTMATVDVKRAVDGRWFFRLNTSWTSYESIKPFYDISEFTGGVKKGPKGKKVEDRIITSVDEVAV
jgi:hypothetical protein